MKEVTEMKKAGKERSDTPKGRKRALNAKEVAETAVLTAVAAILSYLESLIPLNFALSGIKLGLANGVVILALYRLGKGRAIAISLVRVVLLGMLFGNVMTLAYSLSGAVLSFLVMVLLQRWDRFSPVGISIAGAVAHNVGQILVAIFLLETQEIVYYLPPLVLIGALFGGLVGILAAILIKRLPDSKSQTKP